MNKFLLLIILVSIALTFASATSQIPDILIYQDHKYSLIVNPLEIFFELHKEKKPKRTISSLSLWRGYIATYTIKDKLLYVQDIEVECRVKDKKDKNKITWVSVVRKVFPDSTKRFCSWYTGLLVIPLSKIVNYAHMGYASRYEKYRVLRIENGVCLKEREFPGDEYFHFRIHQFEEYKKTEKFKEQFKKLMKDGDDPELTEEFLFEYEIKYTAQFLLDEL